ncbi:hypothetical protein TorRG33x02_048520 [Trema orientale]|uniref:Uncharacterized protein n=1 Tax=Trema orientale TaxID=63057 RepID=A0A2P5FNE9_TREOI|nr:hypothetical protein TorRG33x02_048520 [Trema orientale]
MAPRLGKTGFLLAINPGTDMVLHGLSIGSFLGPVQPRPASPPNPNSSTISDLASNGFDRVAGGVGVGRRVSEGFEVGAASEGERSR